MPSIRFYRIMSLNKEGFVRLRNMNNIVLWLRISPHNPHEGKTTINISCSEFETNTPLRGIGVIKYDNKLFP
jgi:hypothetical protein